MRQYRTIFIRFHIVVSDSEAKTLAKPTIKNNFSQKWHLKVIQGQIFRVPRKPIWHFMTPILKIPTVRSLQLALLGAQRLHRPIFGLIGCGIMFVWYSVYSRFDNPYKCDRRTDKISVAHTALASSETHAAITTKINCKICKGCHSNSGLVNHFQSLQTTCKVYNSYNYIHMQSRRRWRHSDETIFPDSNLSVFAHHADAYIPRENRWLTLSFKLP